MNLSMHWKGERSRPALLLLLTFYTRRSFGLFSEDPAFATENLARAVILEPRLAPLFERVGWSYTGASPPFHLFAY